MGHAAPIIDLLPGKRLQRASDIAAAGWRLGEVAGRLVELSGTGAAATLTAAVRLLAEAQRQGEPVAWLTTRQSCFFPPDVADHGVDLDALAVVRLPDVADIGRAADQLARSGAFGLLVLDMGTTGRLPEAQLTRLLGLAQKHHTAILCLTRKTEAQPSLGSLVSLRLTAHWRRAEPGRFTCELAALKDKRRSPGWQHTETCRGPAGLR